MRSDGSGKWGRDGVVNPIVKGVNRVSINGYKRQKAGLKNPALYLVLKQNIKLIC